MKSIGTPEDPLIFDIHDKFIVQGIGLVVSGLIKQGTLKTHENYLLGPDKTGQFISVTVKTIHMARVLVDQSYAGMFCTA